MARIRPRISILNALLLMTIVAMAIVIVQFWREIGPLRAEVRNLRQQVGVLTIDDPSLVQAIGVPTDVKDTYKWRVYIPTGCTARLRALVGSVARTAYPTAERVIPLSAGEQLITIRTNRNKPTDMSIVAEIKSLRSGSMIVLPPLSGDLSGELEASLVSSKQAQAQDDGKLQLIRKRYSPPGQWQLLGQEAPLPGFIIWLERLSINDFR